MAQWIALAITILGSVIVGATLWGRMSQRQDALEGRVLNLEDNSQTHGEREAVSKLLDAQFKAHEQLDDLRFKNLQETIHVQLAEILMVVKNNGK